MATPVVVRCEVAWGANLAAAPGTWTFTDITADVRTDIGSITVGRADEAATSQPTTVSFTLKDPNGNYVPRNARGINYPYVRQNTPFRLTFATGVRALVYADSYTVSWDESLAIPIVTVSASGSLRRLAQGAAPTSSSLYRTITATGPVAYWTLEDDSGATAAASAVVPGLALQYFASNQSAAPQFGTVTGPGGSGQLPNFANAASLAAYIVPAAGASTPWSFGFAVKASTIATTLIVDTVRVYTTASVWYWDVGARPAAEGGLAVNGTYANNAGTFQILTNEGIDDGAWHWVVVTAGQSGPNINVNVYIDGHLAGGPGAWPVSLAAKILGPINAMLINPSQPSGLYPVGVGHLALWNGASIADQTASMNGYTGETATARLTRLAAEQVPAIPITVTGTSSTLMGVQPMATFLALARACEAADGGVLTDGGTNGGLTYLARSARYNLTAAFVLDNAQGQLARPFQPTEDDQRRRNDVTASRTGGSSGRYTDVTGPQGTAAIGTYPDTVSLNVSSDAVLVDQAAWRVHLGTAETMRYSPVVLNLRARPELVTAWLAAGVGSRFTLRNLPSQHGPGDVDLIVEGWAEHSDGFDWTVAINSSPYDPWRVMKVADAQLGRLDTGGSSLLAGITATDTSATVATTVPPLWVTTATFPADFPFDIGVDGEQITVTAITNNANANAYFESPLNAANWAGVNNATIAANGAQFHEGTQSLLITPDGITAVPQAQSDEIPVVVGRSYTLSGWIRSATGGDTLTLNVFWFNAAHSFLSSSAISAVPTVAVWTQYGPQTFTAPANAAFARVVSNNPATPLATHTWRLDEITLIDTTAQVFTITRSLNTIVKAHSAGAAVNIWRPASLAL